MLEVKKRLNSEKKKENLLYYYFYLFEFPYYPPQLHNNQVIAIDICINGDIFPIGNPALIAHVKPNILHNNVLKLNKSLGGS